MSFEAYPKHVPLAERGFTSARASSTSSTSRKSASYSSSGRTVLSRQQHNQGDLPPVAVGPLSSTDNDEWTDYLPSRKASNSGSPAGRHQGLVHRASGTGVSGRRSRQRQSPDFDNTAERGDVDGNDESPPDDKEEEDVEGEGSGGGADGSGAASSEDAQLLSVAKDDVSPPEAVQGVAEKPREMGDVFERLRQAQHAESPPNEIVFSVQQENDRWLVVFLVAGLYVFFYAIGGLAYYLLDEYGYTVAYSGRTNLSNGNGDEPLGARRH